MPTLAKSKTYTRGAGKRRDLIERKSAVTRRGAAAGHQETLRTIAHDARNVVMALELCCDLLAEPGVLAKGHENFATELRTVASSSAALIGRLAALAASDASMESGISAPIDDLAAAVRQIERPLAALAGPQIRFEMECLGCFGAVHLAHEDLTRILVNLTRNAAEAMPQGGRIRVTVQQGDGGSFLDADRPSQTVLLCVQDSGPGIPAGLMERIFDAGFTTKERSATTRGLGLSNVRRLVERAGGNVRAVPAPGGGTRFEVELPLIRSSHINSGFMADFPERANLKC